MFRRRPADVLAEGAVGTSWSGGMRGLLAVRMRGCRRTVSLGFGGMGGMLRFAHAGGQAATTFREQAGLPQIRGGIATEPPSRVALLKSATGRVGAAVSIAQRSLAALLEREVICGTAEETVTRSGGRGLGEGSIWR